MGLSFFDMIVKNALDQMARANQLQAEQRAREAAEQAQRENQRRLEDAEKKNQELQEEIDSLRASYNVQQEMIQNLQENKQNHQKLTDDVESLKTMLSSILSSDENFKIDTPLSTESTLDGDSILTQSLPNEDVESSDIKTVGEITQIGEFTVLNLLHHGE